LRQGFGESLQLRHAIVFEDALWHSPRCGSQQLQSSSPQFVRGLDILQSGDAFRISSIFPALAPPIGPMLNVLWVR
jgi:hypothetical protein